MASADRQELHLLVDHIPESDLAAARKFLQALMDPVALALVNAPLDDEPEIEEERAELEWTTSRKASWRQYARFCVP